MIASSRLRRVERFARAEYERYYRDRPTPAELADAIQKLFEQARACEDRGDFDNEIVRRAEQLGELYAVARQWKDEADAAAIRSAHRGDRRTDRDGAHDDS
jgi:hypothetical protein